MSSEAVKLRHIIGLDSELDLIQDLDILLERILYETRKAVGADAGSIYIRKPGEQLEIKYSQNETLERRLPPGEKLIYSIFSVPINERSVSGYAAATGKVLNIPDMYNIDPSKPYKFASQYDKASGYHTVSSLTVPLRLNTGEILGVLQMINKMDTDGEIITFDDDDELFVTHFAANATSALQRTQMTRTIILRMIRMAELRDPKETGAHANRVAAYSVEIYEKWARKHHVSRQEESHFKDALRMAAMLHDVGKVAVSDLILKKPGRLTPSEYEEMKRHTFCGAQLFEDQQSEFDKIAIQVALSHHENWDGSGYPGPVDPSSWEPLSGTDRTEKRGLRGEEIPFWGRIVALADVYDALSSKRVYKNAWTEEKILAEIRKQSGRKFQPELVDIFFEVLPNLRQAAMRYPDL